VRVGRIPYLNSEPFYFGFAGHDLISLPPRQLGQAVAAGRVDAGPLSMVDFVALEDRLSAMPFGIATKGPAQSVILFAPCPPKELDGTVIGVSDETSTSVEILRLILTVKYDVRPRQWVGPDDPCDALLLIGDQALRALQAAPPYAYRVDIGAEWVEWTGLPCVFARWAVRRDVDPAERDALAVELSATLDRALGALPLVAAGRPDLGLDAQRIQSYLRGFTYRFGDEEERSMSELRRRLARMPSAC
jgi:chorismate dehydratase